MLHGRPLRAEALEPRQLLAGAEIAMYWRGQELLSGQTFDCGTIPTPQWHGIEKDLTIRNTCDQVRTFSLALSSPTGGAALGTRSTAVLSIAAAEISYGPGTFKDNDGDSYTIKLTGPGTARIRLADPDGDGIGPIDAIFLEGTTTASALAISVSKGRTGDGRVAIGQIVSTAGATGDGSLKSLVADKADVTGEGIQLAGTVGTLTLGNVAGTIAIGGTSAASSKITLGTVRVSEIRCGSTISSLTVNSLRTTNLSTPSIGTLSTKAGILEGNITVAGAIKSISTKGGGASGDWSATSFGTINISGGSVGGIWSAGNFGNITVRGGGVEGDWTAGNFGNISITGGGFTGKLISTRTAASLGRTPAIAKLTTSGDFQGTLHTLGALPNVTIGGSMLGSVVAAATMGTFGIKGNLTDSLVLSGANLGADYTLDGSGDIFSTGAITKFSVGGNVQNSTVGAGLDPVGMTFHNGNDAILGGTASKVGSFTVGGTAGMENYFRAGSWPKTVKIGGATINPLTDARFRDLQNFASAGTTDEDGVVTLQLAGQQVKFSILDDQSGQPIPGMEVGISTGTGTEGVAILAAFDPMGQYPPQFVLVHGEEPGEAAASALLATTESVQLASIEENPAEPPVPIEIADRAFFGAQVLTTIKLQDKLPKIKAPLDKINAVGTVLEAAGHLTKYIDNISGGKVAQAIGTIAPSTVEKITPEEAMEAIHKKAQEGTLQSLTLMGLGFAVGGPAGMLGPSLSLTATGITHYVDEQTVIDTPPDQLVVIQLGYTQLYASTGQSEVIPFAPVDILTPPGTGGSLELINKGHLGGVTIIGVEPGGETPVQIPPGSYEFVQKEKDRDPTGKGYTVPPGGGSIELTPGPKSEIASLTLKATPGITGLLDPGTEIRFTVEARNAAGEIIPPENLHGLQYRVYNPQGKLVGQISNPYNDPLTGPGTGLLTIGPDQGALRIEAVCGAVKTKAKLVSGLGPAFNLPIISIGDASVVEGNSGTTYAVFTVSLSKQSAQAVTVDFNTAWLGSATPGADYTDITGKVTFGPGVTQQQIKVPVLGDLKTEGNETFAVGLSNPTNARLDLKNSAVGTITDDDKPGITITPTSGVVTTESGGQATLKVKLNAQPSENVTVVLISSNPAEGTLVGADEYGLKWITFTPSNWSKEQSVTAKGVDDQKIDGDVAYNVFVAQIVTIDPGYSNQSIQWPTVACTNRDNDTLGPGKVAVTVIGNGYVIDSMGQIDTRVGRNIGTYSSWNVPVLNALTPSGGCPWWVDWELNGKFDEGFEGLCTYHLISTDFQYGLSIVVYIDAWGATATYSSGGVTLGSQQLGATAVDAVFGQ